MGKSMRQLRTALVTGASSGIGEAFARRLAGLGADLVLVATREAALTELANELSARHGISATVLAADLADPAQLATVENRLSDPAHPVDLLVNNAGVAGHTGPFHQAPPSDQEHLVRVNAIAPMRLSAAALPGMIDRGRGGILMVSSFSALLPSYPGAPGYAASKAFLCSLSESLAVEAAPHGVRVTAVCPGPVRTPMTTPWQDAVPERAWIPVEAVVRAGLRGLATGRPLVVPGRQYQALDLLMRHLPRPLARRLAAAMV